MSKKVVFSGKMFTIIQEPVTLPSGKVFLAEYAWRQDGVRVIARNDEGQVLLSDEYRSELGARDLRLPGGKVETDDTPAAAARRELQEETGILAGTLSPLGSSQAYATVRYQLHYFEARQLTQRPVSHDEGEDIRVRWVEAAEAVDMALQGQIGEELSALWIIRYFMQKEIRR